MFTLDNCRYEMSWYTHGAQTRTGNHLKINIMSIFMKFLQKEAYYLIPGTICEVAFVIHIQDECQFIHFYSAF